jgi:hypothetical protein
MDIRRDESLWSHRNHLAVGFLGWRPVRVRNYVCVSCGYLENYIRTEDLRAVARAWRRGGPSKPAVVSDLE